MVSLTMFAAAGVALLVLLCQSSQVAATPLDDYVHAPDPTYKFVDLKIPVKMDGYTVHFLNMTSQTWMSTDIVSCSVWWHIMAVTVPDNITTTDKAFLYITGGDNNGQDSIPEVTSEDVLLTSVLAFSTGVIAASLFQVPNQPCVFTEDTVMNHKRRTEDAIIAFTWYHFLNSPEQPNYLLRLPMTKAAVRAMDTMTTFARQQNSAVNIKKFVIAGASKRGWTTWTTAVVDDRVMAMIPLVMDALNLQKNLHHMYRAYGGWTFAFGDYYDLNITVNLDDPNMPKMTAIVDPYSYITRMTMPKLIVNSGGDEFFLPDDNYYWWDDLPGQKYLRILPNAEHSMANKILSLILGIRAFVFSVMMDVPIPTMQWDMVSSTESGTITVKTNTKPTSVMFYKAHTLSSTRRDFRLLTGPPESPNVQPVLWFYTDITSEGKDNVYSVTEPAPEVGWTAMMIQVTFEGPQDSVHEYTTQVNIVPDTFPFPDCHGKGCKGTLV